MGMTDQWIMPVYAEILSKYIDENVDPGGKIAWLGQQQANKYSDMYQRIVEKTNQKQIEHHFYDILNDDDPPYNYKWDVHDSWENIIKDYDLVLGIRLAYLVQSASGLVKNLKYAVENNKKVVFDFNTANLLTLMDGTYKQSWKKDSTNLVPHFPSRFPKEVKFYEAREDNLLSDEKLANAGLGFGLGWTIGPDPVKGRYYLCAEVVEK